MNSTGQPVQHDKAQWARDVLGLFGTKMILFPLGLVTGILVTRALGPANRGAFAFITLLFGFVGPLLQFGFGNGVRYYVSAGVYAPRSVAFSAFVVQFGLGVFSAIGLATLFHGHLLGKTAEILSWRQMGPVLLVLPLVGAGTVMRWILVGDSQFNYVNTIDILNSLLISGLLLILVILFQLGLDGAIWSFLIAQVFSACLLIVSVFRLYSPHMKIEGDAIQKSLSYGIRIWVGTVATRSNDRLDQFVLAIAASASQLGQYSVAVRVAELPLMLSSVAGPVVFNRVAGSAEHEDRVAVIDRIHRAHIIAIGAVVLILGVVGYFLIPVVYGERFRGAAFPFLLYLPGVIAVSSRQVIGKFISGSGHPGITSLIQVLGLAVAVPAYILLIPRFDVAGAAAASSLVYLASGAATLVFYHRLAGRGVAHPLLFHKDDLKWMVAQVSRGMQGWSAAVGRLLQYCRERLGKVRGRS